MTMKTLYIDIEAAPAKAYIWDLKTRYVPLKHVAEDGYVLCFSYAWDDSDYITSIARWDKGGEKAMVKKAWALLDEADSVIHYNGDNYDLPRLNTEFLKYRLGPPSPYWSVDLFKTVSSTFRVLSKSMQHMLDILE
jgi:DNA polymerase elongation subunit (family B)